MFYKKCDRRASLLAHRHGVHALQFYAMTRKNDKKQKRQSDRALANALKKCIRKQEPAISTTLRDALKPYVEEMGLAITGEREERVQGEIDGVAVSGCPDIVIRKHDRAIMIMEVSVDGNGGEKKIGQAFEYGSVIDDQSNDNEPLLLFTIHINRSKTLKIAQEAFLYVHDEDEAKRKVCFIWREVYHAAAEESDIDLLMRSCAGIKRSIRCAWYLSGIKYDPTSTWEVLSDNTAILNNAFVFKIFDNRFHATFRNTDVWLQDHPWLKELSVVEFLYYQENESVDCTLGRPATREDGSAVSVLPYGNGSARIIMYNRVDGTHIASKVSHFYDIARSISDMHRAGFVHGDIRGFNMLHPHAVTHPQEQGQGSVAVGISTSCLIDFDFSGRQGSVKYPPGYADLVLDNGFPRIGKPDVIMEKKDDCYELASAMVIYQIDPLTKKQVWLGNGATSDKVAATSAYIKMQEAWEDMCIKQQSIGGSASITKEIKQFIDEYGDVAIALPHKDKHVWNQLLMKGTGSPQKKRQGPRGPATTSEPAVAQTRPTCKESSVTSPRQHAGHPVHKRVIPAPHGISSSSAKNVNVNDGGADKDDNISNLGGTAVPRKKKRNEPQPASAT